MKNLFKQAIKAILWMTCIMCIFTILTMKDPRGFGVVAITGLLCTWVLIKWEAISDYIDE